MKNKQYASFARKAQQDLGLLDSSHELQTYNLDAMKEVLQDGTQKGLNTAARDRSNARVNAGSPNVHGVQPDEPGCSLPVQLYTFMKYPPLHKEQVVEFVKNWTSANGGPVNVAGKSVEFTPEALAQRLRLHGDGPDLSQVKPLPKKMLREVLGENVVEAKKYNLNQLTEDWVQWVTFFN